MYGTDYHSHSDYAQEGHTHWDYAPEQHEHELWQVTGAASSSHDHDLSELWDELADLRGRVAELEAALAARNHQET